MQRSVVLIAGPTASGKSALALALAQRIGGLVINADAMQVYGELRVITARPTPGEEARAPHRLYGHVAAAESYSAGRWLEDVKMALAEAARLRLVPIVAGGTGLYFKLLTTGIAAVPPIPSEIRDALRTRLSAEGPAALHAELTACDSVSAARLSPADGVRIARALEVVLATGRALPDWQAEAPPPLIAPAEAVRIFLAPDRAALRARIDARFTAMLAAGALDEVRALAEQKLAPLMPAMKAHGVPALIRHLAGEIDLAEATALGQADTRRYAKRQFTWFRHQLADWPWVAPEAALDAVLAAMER